jgi:hypothetical protein
MKDIRNLEEFIDAVMKLTSEREEWKTRELMNTLSIHILHPIKSGIAVDGDVFTAFFHLFALLGTKASREKIRGAALGVKGWLQAS